MVKMTLSEGPNLTSNFDFRGHVSTFRAKNTPKKWPFNAKTNAQTTSEQLQTNFQKPQEKGFFTIKLFKLTLSEDQVLN